MRSPLASALLHAACALALLCCARSVVRAESTTYSPLPSGARFAMLPTQSALPQAAAGSEAQRAEALQAVTTALRKRGYQVMSEAQVQAALSERLPDGCSDVATCDPKLALHALRVDAVVSLAVWQRKDGAAELVVFVQRHANYGQAERALAAADLADVATDTLATALGDTLVRHEVTVRIESDPPGASVHIDQSPAGRSPVTLELAPGNHLVIIETPGYVTDAHYLDVPRGAAEPFVHTVKLGQPLTASASHEDAPLTAASKGGSLQSETDANSGSDTANYIVAAALGALAVTLLANAVYAADRDGECTGRLDVNGLCSARGTLEAAFWASLGVGAAAGLGAGAVLVFMPLSSSEHKAPTGAALQLRTHF
jgi:PEGA domain